MRVTIHIHGESDFWEAKTSLALHFIRVLLLAGVSRGPSCAFRIIYVNSFPTMEGPIPVFHYQSKAWDMHLTVYPVHTFPTRTLFSPLQMLSCFAKILPRPWARFLS